MYSILLIDEDKQASSELQEYLKREGFKVFNSDRAKAGFLKAKDKKPDMIIMELVYFGQDGFELINEIRSEKSLMYTYLIVFSQKNEDIDKVVALELGADDYVAKPASFRELTARIRSQFKYVRKRSSEEILNFK